MIDVEKRQRLDIALHQNDTRMHSWGLRHPYISLGISVLKKKKDGKLDLVCLKDYQFDRNVEIEVDLEPG